MIFLKAPDVNARGPDGGGRNRLRVETLELNDQCALRPKTAEKFVYESADTRFSHYGGFKPCTSRGVCGSCTIYNESLHSPLEGVGRVMIRIDTRGNAWAMNRPEEGWASKGYILPWELLARLHSHTVEARHISVDKHSRYFWMIPVVHTHQQKAKESSV